MDEFQKKRICELRADGCGYKLIAAELGVSRDVVRNFCRKNGLNGHLAQTDENIRKMIIDNALCDNCGKPIKQKNKGKPRRFCSDECRRSWWKENAEKGQRNETALYKCICKFCKMEFTSYGNNHRKYCSHECYIKDRFGENKKTEV